MMTTLRGREFRSMHRALDSALAAGRGVTVVREEYLLSIYPIIKAAQKRHWFVQPQGASGLYFRSYIWRRTRMLQMSAWYYVEVWHTEFLVASLYDRPGHHHHHHHPGPSFKGLNYYFLSKKYLIETRRLWRWVYKEELVRLQILVKQLSILGWLRLSDWQIDRLTDWMGICPVSRKVISMFLKSLGLLLATISKLQIFIHSTYALKLALLPRSHLNWQKEDDPIPTKES